MEPAGETVGKYRLVRQIGEGGMGTVYLAIDRNDQRKVALKVLRRELSSNIEEVERFFTEARVVNEIGHPHIVDVVGIGRTPEGVHYLAMEYLDGENVIQRLHRDRRFDSRLAVSIAAQTADALAVTHARGIVHRDVKPENIFLTARCGISHYVKLLDFGLAKLAPDMRLFVQTQSRWSMGTPYYMSPEQCAGAGMVDARSDIYSLGVVLFEMVTGRVPFEARGLGLLFMQHMQEAPPRPSSIYAGVSNTLEAVILRALVKKADHRYESMADFKAALLRLGVGPDLPEADVTRRRETPSLGRAYTPPATRRPPEAEATRRMATPPPPAALDRAHPQKTPTPRPAAPAPAEPALPPDEPEAATTGIPARMSSLSRSASEILRETARPRRVRAGFLAVCGAFFVVVLAALALLGGRGERPPLPRQATANPAAPLPAPAPLRLEALDQRAPLAHRRLAIESEPPGATVFRDGRAEPLGVTPLEIDAPAGALELLLRKDGYRDRIEKVAAVGGHTVRVVLEPAPAAPR